MLTLSIASAIGSTLAKPGIHLGIEREYYGFMDREEKSVPYQQLYLPISLIRLEDAPTILISRTSVMTKGRHLVERDEEEEEEAEKKDKEEKEERVIIIVTRILYILCHHAKE